MCGMADDKHGAEETERQGHEKNVDERPITDFYYGSVPMLHKNQRNQSSKES